MLLMEIFSVKLGWLPIVADGSWQSYVLPSLTLGAAVAAVMARFTRASFVEVMHEDFVRTARAKGVPERLVIVKHCLRNALIPVITMMGLQFGFLLGGSIVVEVVFNWPGLGRRVDARLSGDSGRGAVVLARIHHHQPGRGRAVRRDQSDHPFQVRPA
jgi:glutathione transport system permease protein